MSDDAGRRERVLREVVLDDIPVFFEHQREPEANEMAVFPARDEATFSAHWRETILPNPHGIARTIVSDDGAVAGNILCFERDGRYEVAYWIGRDFWGKGLATRALRELLDDVSVRPLYATVAKTNIASIRVLEKCGFVAIGSHRALDAVEEIILELAD